MNVRMSGLGVGVALLLVARSASAVPQHWDVMVEQYGWSGDCTLCHETSVGGASTANQPFALTLQAYGLTAATSRDDLLGILYLIAALGTDSDGDFLSDVPEVAYFGDPNDPEVGLGGLRPDDDEDSGDVDADDDADDDGSTDDATGCASSAGAPGASGGSWALLLLMVAAALRRS